MKLPFRWSKPPPSPPKIRCIVCGITRKLPASPKDGAAGWLIQDGKFYCPVCAKPIRRSAGMIHFYRLHPISGQDAESFEDLRPDFRKEAEADFARQKATGAKFYWHKSAHDKEFSRVELCNAQFAFELSGWTVIVHDDPVPEFKA